MPHLLAAALAAAGATLAASAADLVFLNARVIPIDGPEIERGYVAVTDGAIEAIGTGRYRGDADETVDCEGKVVMPGLICTHSHVGGIGGADGSGPIQPGVRVRDSINVRDGGFRRALAGGLTSLNIMPGSGHLSSGQTVYVKLRHDKSEPGLGVRTIDDITYYDDEGEPMGGLKMANGTNPQRDNGGPFPGTRGRAAYLVRAKFLEVQAYQAKLDAAVNDAARSTRAGSPSATSTSSPSPRRCAASAPSTTTPTVTTTS